MNANPEFSGTVATGSKPAAGFPVWAVRLLIAAQVVAAVLTASYQIDHVTGGLIRQAGWNPESLSVPAFFTAFVFPPMVHFAAKRARLGRSPRGWALVATYSIAAFQCFAIFPAVQ